MYSSSSRPDDDSSSSESSDDEGERDELDDVFVDSLIGKESFIGIVHSG